MPRPKNYDSLAAQLMRYFRDNPDEELSYADIALKMGKNRQTVRDVVGDLRRDGLLESAHVVRLPHKGRMS